MEPSDQPVQTDTAQLPQNGASKTVQLSANNTLFWRVFMPIFGTVLITLFTATAWFIPAEILYLSFPILWLRLIFLALWIGWIYFVRRTIWRLKRIDASDTHLYVTNYWTTLRYPWTDIERVEEKTRLGRQVVNLHLKAPGKFGQILSFLPGEAFEEWKNNRA